MAFLWLLCVPFGFVVLLVLRLRAAKSRGQMEFNEPHGSGSWNHFFEGVKKAEGERVGCWSCNCAFHFDSKLVIVQESPKTLHILEPTMACISSCSRHVFCLLLSFVSVDYVVKQGVFAQVTGTVLFLLGVKEASGSGSRLLIGTLIVLS